MTNQNRLFFALYLTQTLHSFFVFSLLQTQTRVNKHFDIYPSKKVYCCEDFARSEEIIISIAGGKHQLVINWRRRENNKQQTPGPSRFGPIVINQAVSEQRAAGRKQKKKRKKKHTHKPCNAENVFFIN